MTRIDILVVLLIVLSIFGWPSGLIGNRLPEPVLSIIVLVVLVVLLLLGIVRF